MLATLKSTIKTWEGEIVVPLFFIYPDYGDCSTLVIPGFDVEYVIYSDKKTWVGIGEDNQTPDQFYFRAVATNDFGDIVRMYTAKTLAELKHAVEGYMRVSGKCKVKKFKIIPSKETIEYNERYFE